jgi:hypothetical protein
MPSKPSQKPADLFTESLLGTGEFVATREELMEWCRQDSERRLEGLAKYRRFLEEFEGRHGVDVTDLLKAKILGLVQK